MPPTLPPALPPPSRAALLRFGGLLICLLLLPALACQANPFARTSDPATPAPGATPRATPPMTAAPAASVPVAMPLIFTEALAADVDTLNPLLTADPATVAVIGKFLPRLIERDPQTGAPVATGLASGWQWSPDGAVLTVTLRSGVTWSDGTPLTPRDVGFTFAALASPAVNSPLRTQAANLNAIEPVGGDTLVFRLNRPDCAFLQTLTLPILPSHRFAPDLSDITTNPWNDDPTVGAGPFLFEARTPGESVTLVRNPTHWKGAPLIATYRLQVMPDAQERLRALLSGSVDLADELPPEAAALSGGVRPTRLLRDGYAMLALNLGDPETPQPGRSEAGALQPQALHPILGDLRVRQAIAQGMDRDALLAAAYGATAAPLTSWVLPTIPWAFADDLPAYRHDPDAARRLLDEAGWLVGPDGKRMRGGAPLALSLLVNDDNLARVTLAQGLRTALEALGFTITLESRPFVEAAAAVLAQQYDLALVGWEQVGPDPATATYFDSRTDTPGGGLNVTSYQNPVVDTLYDAARTAPACDAGARGELYRQIQRQVFADAPVILLNGHLSQVGVAARWQYVLPAPWRMDADIERWDLGS